MHSYKFEIIQASMIAWMLLKIPAIVSLGIVNLTRVLFGKTWEMGLLRSIYPATLLGEGQIRFMWLCFLLQWSAKTNKKQVKSAMMFGVG